MNRTIELRLTHGEDSIHLYAAVRWCRREQDSDESYEIGLAFTQVGEVSARSLWRSLSVYSDGP